MATRVQIRTTNGKTKTINKPQAKAQAATSPRRPDNWVDKEIQETHRSLIGYLPQYGNSSEKILEHESLLYMTYITTKFVRVNKLTGETVSVPRLPQLKIQGFDLEMNDYRKEEVQKAMQSFQKAGANVQMPRSGQRTALFSSYQFDADGNILNGETNAQALVNVSPAEHKAKDIISIISGYNHGDSFSRASLKNDFIGKNRFINISFSSAKKQVQHYFSESGKMYHPFEIEGMKRKALEEERRKEAEKTGSKLKKFLTD